MDLDLEALRALGYRPLATAPIGQGRNSCVFKVTLEELGPIAIKVHGGNRHHKVDLLRREYLALKFLQRCGLVNVPRPISFHEKAGIAIYELLEGDIPRNSAACLHPMATFVGNLHSIYLKQDSKWRSRIVGGATTFAELLRQIYVQQSEYFKRQPLDADLQKCILSTLRKVADNELTGGIRPKSVIPSGTLSSPDFGPHNMLQHGLTFKFVDFEYFGVDNPMRLLWDVAWHPGNGLTREHRLSWFEETRLYFANSGSTFELDLMPLSSLLGVRWAVIMLRHLPRTRHKILKYLQAALNISRMPGDTIRRLHSVAEVSGQPN